MDIQTKTLELRPSTPTRTVDLEQLAQDICNFSDKLNPQNKPHLLPKALVKAQKEFGPALKSSTNPHFKARYADLAACVEAVIDALNNNGIMLMQHLTPCTEGVTVETIFLHESGEQMSCGQLHLPASKKDAQGFGSCLTYARRYSLMAACGIAPEDDDANRAVHGAPKGNQQSVAAPDITDHIAAIEGSATNDELKERYLAALKACNGHQASSTRVVMAKDKRKMAISGGAA